MPSMSALQLQTLLMYVCNPAYHSVHFRFMNIDGELRLHIWFNDESNNRHHRSFGTDGTYIEYDEL